MEEEDDDFYAPEEHIPLPSTSTTAPDKTLNEQRAEDGQRDRIDQKMTEDLEEGEEEEEEESDSVSPNDTAWSPGQRIDTQFSSDRKRILILSPREKMALNQSLHRKWPLNLSAKGE